jgi:hypothetical protein
MKRTLIRYKAKPDSAEPPVARTVTVVGNYRMLNES